MRILLKVLYWAAVLAISVALLVALILILESRDESQIEGDGGALRLEGPPTAARTR